MTIALSCPSCDAKLKAKEELLGKRVRCPKCGHAVSVEDETPLTLEPLPDEELLSFQSPLPNLPPAPKRIFTPEPAVPARKATRSAEPGAMTPLAHTLCAWQLLFLMLGGLVGGGLGGLAYAINVAIYKTRLPMPAKIVAIIAVGFGSMIAWIVVLVVLQSAMRR